MRAVADGQEVPAGEPGEIVVRGYTVMSGYWGDEEATAEAIDADGGCTPATSASWTRRAT